MSKKVKLQKINYDPTLPNRAQLMLRHEERNIAAEQAYIPKLLSPDDLPIYREYKELYQLLDRDKLRPKIRAFKAGKLQELRNKLIERGYCFIRGDNGIELICHKPRPGEEDSAINVARLRVAMPDLVINGPLVHQFAALRVREGKEEADAPAPLADSPRP